VNAVFSFEITVSVLAGDREGGTFDAGFIPRLKIDKISLVTAAFNPSGVHAKQHFRPILGFRTTGTGIYGQDGILAVIFTIQHQGKVQFDDLFFDGYRLPTDFLDGIPVFFFHGQIEKDFAFFEIAVQGVVSSDAVREMGPFLQDRFGLLRISPESVLGEDFFYFPQTVFLGGDVKDTPLIFPVSTAGPPGFV
jgi:hypothetical protein